MARMPHRNSLEHREKMVDKARGRDYMYRTLNHPARVQKLRSRGFDPVINRHTGRPHEHKREIVRNS